MINILMISVAWNGTGIPLLWSLLPTAGNSGTSDRTELLDRLEARKREIGAELKARQGDMETVIHPNLPELYRRKVASLQQALSDETTRPQVAGLSP